MVVERTLWIRGVNDGGNVPIRSSPLVRFHIKQLLRNKMSIEQEITEKCQTELAAEHVECEVFGEGCQGGAKVDLKVVSLKFEGVPLLKRHQMVNDLFSKELSSNKIHALTIKAWTPAQYEAKK